MMAGVRETLWGWLAKAASEGKDGQPSSKRVGFLYLIGIVGGSITGLTLVLGWVATMNITGPQAVDAARIVGDTLVWIVGTGLTAVTSGYIGGKAVERKGAQADAGNGG